MSAIDADNLSVLLDAMGEELAARDASAHLLVIGGSALLALGAVQRATRDVDVVALQVDGELTTAEPLPEPVADAAAAVARNFALPQDWLNAGPASLTTTATGLPPGIAERAEHRNYGAHLEVSFAARDDLISFKLYALADRGEPRDLADLRALEPTETELHAAARWARTHNMPGPFDDAIERALAAFGVVDEGRADE